MKRMITVMVVPMVLLLTAIVPAMSEDLPHIDPQADEV